MFTKTYTIIKRISYYDTRRNGICLLFLRMKVRGRLTAVLVGNGLLRIANSASGALVGFYLAHLALQGQLIDAALVGGLGVVSNGVELVGAIPLGALSDRLSPRVLLVGGTLAGAVATQLFGISGLVLIFYVSRALEGVAAAAISPAILAYLTDVTKRQPAIRSRVMALFELSLLVGLALGTLVGGVVWEMMATASFSWMAMVYLLTAVLFYGGAIETQALSIPYEGLWFRLRQVLVDDHLRRLAPAWLAVNAVLGLWLTHLIFQLSGPPVSGQYLVGRFQATEIGVFSLIYAVIFGVGILLWGFLLLRITYIRAMKIALGGVLMTNLCLYLLNNSESWPYWGRALVLGFYAFAILIQSGFTPAALTYLVTVAGQQVARGTTMGLYSFLLGLGTALGAAVGGLLARDLFINGLLVGSVLLGVLALGAVLLLPPLQQDVRLSNKDASFT